VHVPLPEQQAAIDAAAGSRRDRLVKAAAILDRVLAEHPGTDDLSELPDELRDAAVEAAHAFQPAAGYGFSEVLLLVLLGACLSGQWFRPMRIVRCDVQAPGLAQCVVADRLFGVFPRADRVVAGIASTDIAYSVEGGQTQESNGHTTTWTAGVQNLSLLDPDGRVLWSASEDYWLGPSPGELGADIRDLASGSRHGPVLRIQTYWPTLFLSSFGVVFFFGPLVVKTGQALRDRGLIRQATYRRAFKWSGLLLSLALCTLAWGLALLGSDPPAFVGRLVGLG
jgi:hypothetical protein